jgi:GTP cyclohydrolase IA
MGTGNELRTALERTMPPDDDFAGLVYQDPPLGAAAVKVLTEAAGLDITSPHGQRTPVRFLQMLKELTTPEAFNFTVFENDRGIDEMITVQAIPFASLCNHHVIPFVGYAHIAYVPDKYIAGLSKFARAVKYFSRQLQVQENLTHDIANFLEQKLDPQGLAVIMEAEHMCMTLRGAQAPGTKTRTADMRGCFSDHTKTAKSEFLATINGAH